MQRHDRQPQGARSLRRRLRRLVPLAVAVLVIGGFTVAEGLEARPAHAGSKVPGIDVSHYQGKINWKKVRRAGIRFAYIKATESTSFVDSKFKRNFKRAGKQGVIRGAYHFARPAASSGKKQADYFIKHGGGWRKGGKVLPGALDLEAGCHGLSKKQMRTWIRSFMKRYHERTGRWAAIYTTTSWWKTCTGGAKAFGKRHPMWLARWASKPGKLPAGWSKYTFWQYTSSGKVAGIAGNVDRNKFNGSMTRLRKLARGTINK